MVNGQWGMAALVAALAFGTPAWAQSSGTSGSQMGTGGQRDPNSGSARSSDTSSGADTGAMSGPKASSQGTGSSSSGQKLDKKLTDAAEKLHAANQGEIQMGQMGQQMATSPEVKQFAQKMIDDHTKNDDQLQQKAQTMGIQLTGKTFQDEQKDAQKAMQKLQGKQGADFDKAYMSQMVDDHKKDAKELESAAKHARESNHTELASFLEQTHTTVSGHLQEAQRIEQQLKSGGGQAHMGTSGAGQTGTGSSSGSSGMGGGTGGSSSGGAGSSGTGAGGSGGGTGGSTGTGK